MFQCLQLIDCCLLGIRITPNKGSNFLFRQIGTTPFRCPNPVGHPTLLLRCDSGGITAVTRAGAGAAAPTAAAAAVAAAAKASVPLAAVTVCCGGGGGEL